MAPMAPPPRPHNVLRLLAAAAMATTLAAAAPAGPGLTCGDSLCFSGGFAHNAVLQRAPLRAALYGASGRNFTSGTPISLSFMGVDGGGARVNLTLPTASGADGTWKVLLPPFPAGGNFTARVSCPLCVGGPATAEIHSLQFGEVILCAGRE